MYIPNVQFSTPLKTSVSGTVLAVGIEENLVSKEAQFLVEQNPPETALGKLFYSCLNILNNNDTDNE